MQQEMKQGLTSMKVKKFKEQACFKFTWELQISKSKSVMEPKIICEVVLIISYLVLETIYMLVPTELYQVLKSLDQLVRYQELLFDS